MHALLRVGLALSIAVVFPLMAGFGIDAFHPAPPHAYEACQELLAESQGARPAPEPRDPMLDPAYRACHDEAQLAVNRHKRDILLITVVLGFGAIAAGALLFREELGPVGPGLVFGGLITILYGALRASGAVDERWIFVELVAAFVGLILVTRRYVAVTRREVAPRG